MNNRKAFYEDMFIIAIILGVIYGIYSLFSSDEDIVKKEIAVKVIAKDLNKTIINTDNNDTNNSKILKLDNDKNTTIILKQKKVTKPKIIKKTLPKAKPVVEEPKKVEVKEVINKEIIKKEKEQIIPKRIIKKEKRKKAKPVVEEPKKVEVKEVINKEIIKKEKEQIIPKRIIKKEKRKKVQTIEKKKIVLNKKDEVLSTNIPKIEYTTTKLYEDLEKQIYKNIQVIQYNKSIISTKIKLTILSDGSYEQLVFVGGDKQYFSDIQDSITKIFPLEIKEELKDKFPRYFRMEIVPSIIKYKLQ